MKKLLFKFPLLTIAIVVLLLYGILTLLFFQGGNSPTTVDTTLTPTPPPFEFTSKEKSYPEATPQAFQIAEDVFEIPNQSMDTGSLVVTSTIDSVMIYIDPPPDIHSEGTNPNSNPDHAEVPDQYTPFKIETLPVGEHRIVAVKLNYISEEFDIVVKKNEVTRIQVSLQPVTQ